MQIRQRTIIINKNTLNEPKLWRYCLSDARLQYKLLIAIKLSNRFAAK